MPCMYNGQPVKGNKGACPTGSTWSDTAPTADAGSLSSGWDALKSMDTSEMSDWAVSRYTKDDGSIDWVKAGIEASWLYPGTLALKGGLKGIPWLMKRMFTKPKMKTIKGKKDVLKNPDKWKGVDIPPWSAYKTIKTKTKVPAMRYDKFGNEIQKRALSPTRATLSAAAIGMGGQGLDYVAPFTERGKAEKAVRDANAATVAAQTQANEQNVTDATAIEAAKVQAEKDRVANLSFTEKMKEPGYWDEKDATGLTRIEKLGQLMEYFGKTPKQRTDSISPADRWAEMTTANAATAASLQKSMLADSPFSNIGDKTGMASIKKLVQEEYGDKWYTWGAEAEEVDQITAAIYTRMVNLSKLYPGRSILQYYEEAKADYDASEEA